MTQGKLVSPNPGLEAAAPLAGGADVGMTIQRRWRAQKTVTRNVCSSMTSEISSSRTLRRTILELRVRRIPTGFRPKAQGCAERATLGHRSTNISNRKRGCGDSHSRTNGHNLVEVVRFV